MSDPEPMPEIVEETRMRSPWPSVLAIVGILIAGAIATCTALAPTDPPSPAPVIGPSR